ncbi:MCE family protein [Mycolicibacterium holsaticum]|uniref:Mammalian cell entry protein n=1 Tax=Mycolicibacterium holsaticum TaxID=152142 RepID=A0A1E3RUN0_9MYCO|nr:MCE family protein [Mycolicibacterium holsaticum]ODQ93067.1 mammalian cell entry protein [Mycolicibacterium holsaticum]QZA15441.1 MCE family protein [Mycolicibacterium holsaticum DSM 44478 = JCM 12374]UNC12287.1 MCE family protein [Mycolicibacterium holsaticum DSM 44478 = JCM 12374]
MRIVLAGVLAVTLAAGVVVVVRHAERVGKVWVTAYFENTTGLFAGDDVRILGVPVGRVDRIEPQPTRAKVTFWVDRKYPVPADAKAVILSPQLVTGRTIQLTPAYTGGPTMPTGTIIPQERTAVPVEWDDVRIQLQRLTTLLQPTEPGGVSTLGAVINTAADNLRGQGADIRETVVRLSATLATLGDHSSDIFTTFTNLSTLVSALHDSADLLEQLNGNMAAVSALVVDDPQKVARTLEDLGDVIGDVKDFADDNREAIGTATDKLASISDVLVASLDDLEQTLHIAPGTVANFYNIFEPANGALTGALAVNNFANPISFICGAIQAASRRGAEQSAKLCAQYLAPIVKNRQYNFPPIGENLLVGAQARPNEVTYSEDRMRPDYIPPAAGLPAMMVPANGGHP